MRGVPWSSGAPVAPTTSDPTISTLSTSASTEKPCAHTTLCTCRPMPSTSGPAQAANARPPHPIHIHLGSALRQVKPAHLASYSLPRTSPILLVFAHGDGNPKEPAEAFARRCCQGDRAQYEEGEWEAGAEPTAPALGPQVVAQATCLPKAFAESHACALDRSALMASRCRRRFSPSRVDDVLMLPPQGWEHLNWKSW